MNKPIVVYGSLAFDTQLVSVPNLVPVLHAVHEHETSVCQVHASNKAFGGNAGNVAYYLAKLGVQPLIVSTVGYDGDSYLERLKNLKLDTRFIEKKKDIPTTTVWVVQDNTCKVAFYDDRASQQRSMTVSAHELHDAIVLVSPGKPTVTIDAVQKSSAGEAHLIMWDPGQDVEFFSTEDVKTCLKHVDMIILNEHELDILLRKTDITIDDILEHATLVETLGEKGVLIRQKDHDDVHVDPVKPKHFVSSWGAGDSFRSGILFGMSNGKSLVESAQLGCKIASIVVEAAESQREDFVLDI